MFAIFAALAARIELAQSANRLHSSEGMRPTNADRKFRSGLHSGRRLFRGLTSMQLAKLNALALTSFKASSLQSSRTYLSKLAGLAWLLVGLFALTLYSLCFLHARSHITVSEGSVLLEAYWAGSALYLSNEIYRNFPQFYGYMLRRMRLYTIYTWYIFFYIILFCSVTLIFLYTVLNITELARSSIASCSLRPILIGFGASIFIIIVIYTVVSNVIADSRGVSCFRSRVSTSDEL